MNPDPTDLREVLVSAFLDHPSATLPALSEYSSGNEDDVTDAYAIVDRIIADDRLLVALRQPSKRCGCVEDVVCGACMTGAVDPVTGAATPPADDVREALIRAIGAHLYGEKSPARLGAIRLADMILAAPDIEVRPRGTVTDADALRLGKVAWVAYQDDKSWAESVVEDCFSPADDLPEEALDMIAVARAVLEADRGVRP